MNKEAHGFGRCTHAYTSGAQMHRDTEEFFMKLAMPVLNSYAMSEATGVITAMQHFYRRYSWVLWDKA